MTPDTYAKYGKEAGELLWRMHIVATSQDREIDRLRAEVDAMREEAMARGAVNRELHAEVEALKQERDKWHHRAKMLWEGYLLTEQMNMPEIELWFRGEVD